MDQGPQTPAGVEYQRGPVEKASLLRYPLRGLLPYGASVLAQRAAAAVDTVLARWYLFWWGIEVGRKPQFFGLPRIRRHPTGRISLGDGCSFRSAEWSNTIGVNRRCFLAAGRDAVLSMGNQCGLTGTVIAAAESIRLGDRVLCGANCTIVDTDRHPIDPIARARNLPARTAPVVIEDDVWLGMNVTVLKGCRIGQGTMVAAGSVVTRSLPEHVLAAGIPARVLRTIPA